MFMFRISSTILGSTTSFNLSTSHSLFSLMKELTRVSLLISAGFFALFDNWPRKNVVIESESVRSIIDFAESEELSDEARVRKSKQLEGLQLLRVLDWYDEVPKRIGEFIHLRYLSLAVESCGQIPKSMKNLINLFYFWFFSTEDEVEVPIGLFCNMKNLRLLSLPFSLKRGSESLDTASLGLTCLENLQSLTSGAGNWMLNELPALSPTVREIYIENIRTPEEIEAVYQCPSVVEDRLGTLSLVHVDGEDLEFDLQKVGHCKTLWSLYLDGCLVMGDPVFPPNLMDLYLSHVKMEEGGNDLMQALGQLSNLKILTLLDVHNCGKVVSLKAGAFPQLQELELIDLDTLEELMMEEGAMPRLTNSRIRNCQNLKTIPQRLIQSMAEHNSDGGESSGPEEDSSVHSDGGESSCVEEDSSIIEHNSEVFCYESDE